MQACPRLLVTGIRISLVRCASSSHPVRCTRFPASRARGRSRSPPHPCPVPYRCTCSHLSIPHLEGGGVPAHVRRPCVRLVAPYAPPARRPSRAALHARHLLQQHHGGAANSLVGGRRREDVEKNPSDSGPKDGWSGLTAEAHARVRRGGHAPHQVYGSRQIKSREGQSKALSLNLPSSRRPQPAIPPPLPRRPAPTSSPRSAVCASLLPICATPRTVLLLCGTTTQRYTSIYCGNTHHTSVCTAPLLCGTSSYRRRLSTKARKEVG